MDTFFTDEIHWFPFLNALVITSFLLLLIWIIFQKIQRAELINTSIDMEDDRRGLKFSLIQKIYCVIDDDLNWKMIRIEIFKCPKFHNLLCAAVGNGFQLAIIVKNCSICIVFPKNFLLSSLTN